MRVKLLVLAGLAALLLFAAQAQSGRAFTTSGGLILDAPDGYLVTEIAPLKVGLIQRETGALIIIDVAGSDADADDLMAVALRRFGGADVQSPALEIRTDTAQLSLARVMQGDDSLMVGRMLFADGHVGLLTITPADSVPRTVLNPLVGSIRFTTAQAVVNYPLCGSETLPQALTTSGGLSLCFPAHYTGEEKGANTIGLASVQHGVFVTVYAREDLATFIRLDATDDLTAVTDAFGARLTELGAAVDAEAQVSLEFSGGPGVLIPVTTPDIGAGLLMAVQTKAGVIVMSVTTFDGLSQESVGAIEAVLSTARLGAGSEVFGLTRPAGRVHHVGGVGFEAPPEWTQTASDTGFLALEHADSNALLNVMAALPDASWNMDVYIADILRFAAQFAGDVTFDESAVGFVEQEEGYTLALYNSAGRVAEDMPNAVNVSAMLTLDDRAFVVFQVNVPRENYDEALRQQVANMALSVVEYTYR